MNAILEHELVGIDATGRLCACGESFDREHLGQVALTVLNAGPSVDERRAADREYQRTWRDRAAARRLKVTRRILAEQQAEWERIGAHLDYLGLSDVDRLDWLHEHYPNASRREHYGY